MQTILMRRGISHFLRKEYIYSETTIKCTSRQAFISMVLLPTRLSEIPQNRTFHFLAHFCSKYLQIPVQFTIHLVKLPLLNASLFSQFLFHSLISTKTRSPAAKLTSFLEHILRSPAEKYESY